MFVPRPLMALRVITVGAGLALLVLVTAFTYEAADLSELAQLPELPFTGDDEEQPGLETISEFEPIGVFAAPIEMITREGDARIFVVELVGTIVAADARGGSESTPILDVSALTAVEGERGLLGAAFHPEEPLLYVHYSDLQGDSVIAEYQVDPRSAVADPDSARQVVIVDQPYDNHNGGELAFGPDGYLYAGFGDGGFADDPNRSALDLGSRLGKILRIDPRQSGSLSFTVPADNPFVNVAGADPAIWSYGLRNPWKFSFDPATGDLWIADVGQNQWEEINAAPATDGAGAGRGLSFGWSAFEGPVAFNDDQLALALPAAGHTEPFFAYERAEGACSISGGAVYRGAGTPSLEGWYVYGDYCTGQIFGIDAQASSDARTPVELGHVDALVAIVAGPDGALYAASVTGPVYRIG